MARELLMWEHVLDVLVAVKTCYRLLLNNGCLFLLNYSGFQLSCHNIKGLFNDNVIGSNYISDDRMVNECTKTMKTSHNST
jgi:hypothetical protein